MSHYKVRRTRPDWFNEDFTEDDERSGALVEDLNRKLTEQHEATDIALEALKPGYGVWLRIDSDRNPLAALAGFGRAACRHPWKTKATEDADIHDTALVHISKADLSGCQMDDQCLKAVFKNFFSQLRLLRPVAMLHLAGCGLTKTCARLFSWCAATLELTRLDVSNNPDFSFQGDSPFAELDLQGFSSFIRRSAHLEALRMHHTGFSNPQLASICDTLGAMGKSKLKHISIGPPRDLVLTAEGCQLQDVPFSGECLAAVASMLRSLTSVDLLVIHGPSPEQADALCAAAPSRLRMETSDDGSLRLSSASREAVEWAEFGPMELDERLLTRPEVHTMDADAEAGDEHMAQHGGHDVPAAALATAPGKLHVTERAQQRANPLARAHAARHHQPRKRHRRRPQSGGPRCKRPAGEQQMRRRKKRRPAAAGFIDDAAGVGAAGEEVAEVYAVGASGSDQASGSDDDEHSNCSGISLDSQAPSESEFDAEDDYREEDWVAVKQARAGAANTDAFSDASLLQQEPEPYAKRPQHDMDARQQAVSPRQGARTARPNQGRAASGYPRANAPPATGSASPRTPRHQLSKEQKRRKKELDNLKIFPNETRKSAKKHPAGKHFAEAVGKRRQTRDVASELAKAMQASLRGHVPVSNSLQAQQEPHSLSQDTALPDAFREQPPCSAEPSQGYELSEGSEVPATARLGAVILDSEDQEAMQLTRPGSGAQRPLSLPDSEDQELQTQPDVQILDSEEQNRLNQPGEASLPEPRAAGEASDQAVAGCEGAASEGAANGAASHERKTVQVQAAQRRAAFEASIAHPPVNRELRGLQCPFYFDKCLEKHPPNMEKFLPKDEKRQVRQPKIFTFEGSGTGDVDDEEAGQSPGGHSREADASEATDDDEDERPLWSLVKRSESRQAALPVPVAVQRDSAADSAAQEDAAIQQPGQPDSPFDISLTQSAPAEACMSHNEGSGLHKGACNAQAAAVAVPERAPALSLEAEVPALTEDEAQDVDILYVPRRSRCPQSVIAQGFARTHRSATRSSTSQNSASDGAASQQDALAEHATPSVAMSQAQQDETQGGQPASSEEEEEVQLPSRRAWRPSLWPQDMMETEAGRMAIPLRSEWSWRARVTAPFASDRQRDESFSYKDVILPEGSKRPRPPPGWMKMRKEVTIANKVQPSGGGPGLTAAAQRRLTPPAAALVSAVPAVAAQQRHTPLVAAPAPAAATQQRHSALAAAPVPAAPAMVAQRRHIPPAVAPLPAASAVAAQQRHSPPAVVPMPAAAQQENTPLAASPVPVASAIAAQQRHTPLVAAPAPAAATQQEYSTLAAAPVPAASTVVAQQRHTPPAGAPLPAASAVAAQQRHTPPAAAPMPPAAAQQRYTPPAAAPVPQAAAKQRYSALAAPPGPAAPAVVAQQRHTPPAAAPLPAASAVAAQQRYTPPAAAPVPGAAAQQEYSTLAAAPVPAASTVAAQQKHTPPAAAPLPAASAVAAQQRHSPPAVVPMPAAAQQMNTPPAAAPVPVASAIAAQQMYILPATPVEASKSSAKADIVSQSLTDLVPDSEDEA